MSIFDAVHIVYRVIKCNQLFLDVCGAINDFRLFLFSSFLCYFLLKWLLRVIGWWWWVVSVCLCKQLTNNDLSNHTSHCKSLVFVFYSTYQNLQTSRTYTMQRLVLPETFHYLAETFSFSPKHLTSACTIAINHRTDKTVRTSSTKVRFVICAAAWKIWHYQTDQSGF